MGKLYLIGTNHQDRIYGPKNLKNLYDKLKPDMLLTEFCQEDLDKIKSLFSGLEDILKKVPSYKNGVDDFIKIFLPFEYDVNEEYSKTNKLSHHLIDLPGSGFNKLFVKTIEKSFPSFKKTVEDYLRVFGPDNLKRDFETTLGKKAIRDPEQMRKTWEKYSRSEKSLGHEFSLLTFSLIGALGKRDKYMEDRIRELYDPGKVITCTVGMAHTLESRTKKTLYSKIKDLDVERVPLIS